MTYAINIESLTKTYGGATPKNALNNVDLKIKKGSFFGLLGPNGAGKSTMINILAGLVKKNSGTVKISGIDIDQNLQQSKYKIGIVPQEIVIDPFFNVRETLEIYAGYFGIKKQDRKTDQIIEALGLQDKINAAPRSLSGGMKRRLLVAKALVHQPEILVLDEPTAGVDVELRTQLWDYVKKLNEAGTTIVLTTHYLEEAEQLCDEIAVINKGKVIACDKKENLMKTLSKKELLISVDVDPKGVVISSPGVESKILGDGRISMVYDPDQIEISEIIKSIMDKSVEIKDISTKQPDLEEIFKYLINERSK